MDSRQNSMKIASLIIAKNEEMNIHRCIQSQLKCIDTIYIFVDNSTTDKTLEIAKSFQKVVCELVRWEGYAKTKTKALEKIEEDWVFWIDADEEITEELESELLKLKAMAFQPSIQHKVYEVNRKAFFLGKWINHSGWYPNRVKRLFNKKDVAFNANDVHEGLEFNQECGRLTGHLNHFTDPNIEHYYKKFNHYTSLAANELSKKGKKARLSDLLLRPSFLFIKMYLLKRGFLDGWHGFILSVFSANYVFTKYAKLWEKQTLENQNK